MYLSRSRVAAVVTMAAVAAPTVGAFAPTALGATTPPKAGKACKKGTKATKTLKCATNKKGKYVWTKR